MQKSYSRLSVYLCCRLKVVSLWKIKSKYEKGRSLSFLGGEPEGETA